MMKFLPRLKQLLSRTYAFVEDIYTTKKAVKESLSEHQMLMQPGWYWIDRSVAYRIGSPTPAALRNSKSYRVSARARPLGAHIVRLADAICPPFLCRVEYICEDSLPKSSQLLKTYDGNIKFFDISSNTVTTIFPDDSSFNIYQRASNALADFLPIITSREIANGSSLGVVEPLLEGATFSDISPPERLKFYSQLIEAYIRLIHKNVKVKSSGFIIQDYMHTLKHIDLPTALQDAIETHKQQIMDVLIRSPLVSSHGDLYAKNIMVTDETVTLIDFETFSELPFFYDLFRLAISEAVSERADLLEYLFKKPRADLVDKLLDEAGLADNISIFSICLAFVLVHFLMTERAAAVSPRYQEVDLIWQVIAPYAENVA